MVFGREVGYCFRKEGGGISGLCLFGVRVCRGTRKVKEGSVVQPETPLFGRALSFAHFFSYKVAMSLVAMNLMSSLMEKCFEQ